jgi:hypothetical protein
MIPITFSTLTKTSDRSQTSGEIASCEATITRATSLAKELNDTQGIRRSPALGDVTGNRFY